MRICRPWWSLSSTAGTVKSGGTAWHGEAALVVPLRRFGQEAVLKVSYPHVSSDGEVAALRHFDGRAAVRLLAVAESESAVLLERAGPRTLASVTTVEQVIDIAGALARQLAVPAYDRAPSLAGTSSAWAEQLDRQRSEYPDLLSSAAIVRARQTIEELGSDHTSTMLHGDLHVGNVLAGVREPWLTIDPVGWQGTAAFDAFTVVARRRED